MDNTGPEITFMFQFGLIRDAITVPQSSLNLKTIKDLACDFINSKVNPNYQTNHIIFTKQISQIPDHSINKLEDRLLLFRHEYTSNNILQFINSAADITDETLIEIVLTGKRKRNNCFYELSSPLSLSFSAFSA